MELRSGNIEKSSLKNRQNLVGDAKRKNAQRCGKTTTKDFIHVVWGPRTVLPLVGQQRLDQRWKKLLPVLSTKLIHGLCAEDNAVVVPVAQPIQFVGRFIIVVIAEIVLQNPLP